MAKSYNKKTYYRKPYRPYKNYRRKKYSGSGNETFATLVIVAIAVAIVPTMSFDSMPAVFETSSPLASLVFLVAFGLIGVMVLFLLWRAIRDYKRNKLAKYAQEERFHARNAISMWMRMDPHDFEHEVAEIFRRQGFKATVSPKGPDKGIDIRLEQNGQQYIVEVKRYAATHNVDSKQVRSTYASFIDEGYVGGFLVTTSGFTKDGLAFAEGKPYRLIDGEKLSAAARGELQLTIET